MLKAGIGKCDVSPRKPMFLVGYPHIERTSVGIHDPLYASALCLDDGNSRIISVAVDILFVSSEMVRECRYRINTKTGINPENIMITATHTHSGPVTCDILAFMDDPLVPAPDPEYMELLVNGIVDAACRAVNATEPAELAVTTAQVDGVGCNRLSQHAVRDPEAGIIVVRQQNTGSIMAIQLYYSMHPTVMHEDSPFVSSDFPAYTRKHLEDKFSGVAVLYHNGNCGNLSPRYHVKKQTFAEAERLGRRLGEFAGDAISEINDADYKHDITLKSLQGFAQLKPRTFCSVEEAEINLRQARENYKRLKSKNAGHGPVRTAECTVFGAEEVVTMAKLQNAGILAEKQAEYAKAEIQILQIGDTCIVGIPGECFVEYSLDIKKRAAKNTFVASLANGELQGYITTPEAVGYEANLSMFKPESGAIMVEMALELIGETDK